MRIREEGGKEGGREGEKLTEFSVSGRSSKTGLRQMKTPSKEREQQWC